MSSLAVLTRPDGSFTFTPALCVPTGIPEVSSAVNASGSVAALPVSPVKLRLHPESVSVTSQPSRSKSVSRFTDSEEPLKSVSSPL